MMMSSRLGLTIGVAALFLAAGTAGASGTGLDYHVQGGAVTLPVGGGGSPDYNWWYGCSPTAAGMIMAYYDRNGYENLVPDSTAPLSNYAADREYVNPDAAVNQIIASTGHQHDFYSARDLPDPAIPTYPYNTGGEWTSVGYGRSNDDVYSGRAFDCLADFMGTSQDNLGTYMKDGVPMTVSNPNGSTWFWYYDNGTPLHHSTLLSYGPGYWNTDGMYGLGEYVTSRGYEVSDLYTQLTSNKVADGFTFTDYKAEIDAGRVVMLHLDDHSIFGYGYDAATGTILFHDGWWEGEDSMA